MDSATRARILARLGDERPPPGTEETPEQVRDATRAILAAHAPPTPPDPLTGRVVTPSE